MTTALAAEHDATKATRRIADSRLHLLIGELSGSPSVAAAVAEVQEGLDDLLAGIPVFDRNIVHSQSQHAAVVRAILGGEPVRARDVMAEHVEGTAAVLRGLPRLNAASALRMV